MKPPDESIAPLIISEGTFDDLLRAVVSSILDNGLEISPTKGAALDLNGVTLELTNPRARLSRSVTRGRLFSCLGELCWYLSGTDDPDHIAYYISHYAEQGEGSQVPTGYGPRMFGPDGLGQVHDVIQLLRRNPDSRRAVVPILERADFRRENAEPPCTCLLQFLIRRERLHLVTYMRSNDVYLGLPHDLFAFTMLQELVATTLGVPLGGYMHVVGSLHLYASDQESAKTFLSEGWQSTVAMPKMPKGNPWPMVKTLLDSEQALRAGTDPLSVPLPADGYWSDLVRVLQAFSLYRQQRDGDVLAILDRFESPTYQAFVRDKTN